MSFQSACSRKGSDYHEFVLKVLTNQGFDVVTSKGLTLKTDPGFTVGWFEEGLTRGVQFDAFARSPNGNKIIFEFKGRGHIGDQAKKAAGLAPIVWWMRESVDWSKPPVGQPASYVCIFEDPVPHGTAPWITLESARSIGALDYFTLSPDFLDLGELERLSSV